MESVKPGLTLEELERETAVELPARNMMALVTVVFWDVIDVGNVVATVQVPIGIAANVCGVQANVLAQQINQEGSATCPAQADTAADAMTQLPRAFRQ